MLISSYSSPLNIEQMRKPAKIRLTEIIKDEPNRNPMTYKQITEIKSQFHSVSLVACRTIITRNKMLYVAF